MQAILESVAGVAYPSGRLVLSQIQKAQWRAPLGACLL